MKLVYEDARPDRLDWRELFGLELDVPHCLSVEWLLDRAEQGEWSGLWW